MSELLKQFFKGRTWDSMQPYELWWDGLFHLSPAAVRYYLPAYLLGWNDNLVADASATLFYHLTPPELVEVGDTLEGTNLLRARFHNNFDDFTPAQKEAVQNFLDYAYETIRTESGGMKESVETYWSALRGYWATF
ncbi:hypothetical protein EON83_09815 [bacterium]|nr:MAG: hypothetical protein EON83_09815 [bacterium]